MADKSNIEWTDATWNPTVGCSIVSPGCTHCYAMKQAARIIAMAGTSKTALHYDKTIKDVKGTAVWTGQVNLAPEHILTAPLHRKKPRRIFVNSMSDLFHESVPEEWIDRVFAVMALCPQHTFQVLTKRAERMRAYLSADDVSERILTRAYDVLPDDKAATHLRDLCEASDAPMPLPNVWLGVSAERQQEADERIPLLLQTPADVRFVSAEPMLGPIDVWAYIGKLGWQEKPGDVRSLDWIIVGGESGKRARPMHPDWARSLRDQCAAAGVPFFFKQWGEFVSVSEVEGPGAHHRFGDGATVRRVGKKAAGRLLDGVEHSEWPEVWS